MKLKKQKINEKDNLIKIYEKYKTQHDILYENNKKLKQETIKLREKIHDLVSIIKNFYSKIFSEENSILVFFYRFYQKIRLKIQGYQKRMNICVSFYQISPLKPLKSHPIHNIIYQNFFRTIQNPIKSHRSQIYQKLEIPAI